MFSLSPQRGLLVSQGPFCGPGMGECGRAAGEAGRRRAGASAVREEGAGQLQFAAVCECVRVRAELRLRSAPAHPTPPPPSMTSHFPHCLCMVGWERGRGGAVGSGVRKPGGEKKLAPLIQNPHLGKRSREGVGVRWGWGWGWGGAGTGSRCG